jgi:hypothetical protein
LAPFVIEKATTEQGTWQLQKVYPAGVVDPISTTRTLRQFLSAAPHRDMNVGEPGATAGPGNAGIWTARPSIESEANDRLGYGFGCSRSHNDKGEHGKTGDESSYHPH